MAEYKVVKVPKDGAKITMGGNKQLQVPDNPIIPFIEGDGTGRDIWRASVRVFDAAVEKASKGKKKIRWMEVYAGEKSFKRYNSWLHDETVPAFSEYLVGIKGPLTTPIGGGMTSLNVGLRKLLDLYVCQRPVRYFNGVPSPLKHPEYVDMIVFRENTEDIYTGIEFPNGTEANAKFKSLLKETFPKEFAKIRFPNTAAIGLKPVSVEGTERLVRAAIQWALKNKRKNINFVHKDNIMKYTEGESWILGNKEADANVSVENNAKMIDPGFDMMSPAQQNDIKKEIEEALKLWPTYDSGHAVFEATHGTAPKYADLDKVNPGSVILSGEMMLRYMGWTEAADLIIKGIEGAVNAKTVTYDFERLMPGSKLVSCSGFGDAIIANM